MSDTDSLHRFLDEARGRVDEALERFLPRPPGCPAVIAEAMRYSVFAGGKRLRPVLTLAAADAVDRACLTERPQGARLTERPQGARLTGRPRGASAGVTGQAQALALPAACAVELIHTYSLIHDDLPAMDNDTLRRGRPTLHVVYGEGIAILAGDGLQAEAFTLLAARALLDDPVLMPRVLRVLHVVGEAAGSVGMVGGQALDLQAAGQVRQHPIVLDADGLREMHARKTGALIRASAVSGAIMAGADDEAVEAIDRYAADLGLAFQIVDDILDVEGNETELGKTAGKDASAAKPTYPSLFGLEHSRALAAECIARAKQTLADAGLRAGWLAPIADWVVERKN